MKCVRAGRTCSYQAGRLKFTLLHLSAPPAHPSIHPPKVAPVFAMHGMPVTPASGDRFSNSGDPAGNSVTRQELKALFQVIGASGGWLTAWLAALPVGRGDQHACWLPRSHASSLIHLQPTPPTQQPNTPTHPPPTHPPTHPHTRTYPTTPPSTHPSTHSSTHPPQAPPAGGA